MVLTLGATAVSTRTRTLQLFGATGAPQSYLTGIGCAAAQQRTDGFEVSRQ
jgi:hypothetical protein